MVMPPTARISPLRRARCLTSAKPDGVAAAYQPWIPTGEQCREYNSDGGAYVRLTSYWLHGYRALPYILIQTDSESGGDISPESYRPPHPTGAKGGCPPRTIVENFEATKRIASIFTALPLFEIALYLVGGHLSKIAHIPLR